MSQSYFPFDSGAGANATEAMWTKMAQHWLNTGVLRSVLNELIVYADSTGMQVKVNSGAAWIKGHYFESDAEEVLAISSANASNPRIDRVIVRLDWTENTIQLAVLQGVPAASPTAPALTQNTSRWEINLAQIRVNASVSTIASSNVTEERKFVDTQETLWTGASYTLAANTIVPTSPLSKCRNGWMLVWSDNSPTGTVNDWDFAFTPVPKEFANKHGGAFCSFIIGTQSDGTSKDYVMKKLAINNTSITGHDDNSLDANGTKTVVLRYVLAY